MKRLATTFLFLAVIAFAAMPAMAQGQRTEPDPQYVDAARAAQIRREALMQGEQRRLLNAQKVARARAKALKAGKPFKTGQRVARALPPDLDMNALQAELRRAAKDLSVRGGGTATLAAPVNVRLNNPAGDAFGSGQSEVSIALVGPYGVAGWNDGQGFVTPPGGQGVAYTTDGGATWVDAGNVPLGGGGLILDWTSDPVVAVNEKTGEFYYCGLLEGPAGTNGLGTIKITFPGGVFTWGTPNVVQTGSDLVVFHDKQWMVADSVSGNLYLSWTNFVVGSNSIQYRRSTDGGVSWDPVIKINAGADDGAVQASRPVVAGDGKVYITWKVLGAGSDDFIKIRSSVDNGQNFGSETVAMPYVDNFGTGAPGFNRNRNVVEPGNAVDRSFGPTRGRIAVCVHESVNFYDDSFNAAGPNKSEVEAGSSARTNNGATVAVPFAIGNTVRGRMNNIDDRDWYSFTGTAGQTYAFYMDSVAAASFHTFRIFCGSDTLTSLAFSSDVTAPVSAGELLVWSAPGSATYYMRLVAAGTTPGFAAGNYRIRTFTVANGGEVGRDMRDATMRYSDDGGATWSASIRMNDDAGNFDNFLPEIGYTTEGYLYGAWYDHRDALLDCGGTANIYIGRSRDGGATWDANQIITTQPSPFSKIPSNIAPNLGDYIGLYTGGAIALGWGDGRTWASGGDLDSWGAFVTTDFTADAPADTAADPSAALNRFVQFGNSNVVFSLPLNYSVSVSRSWPGYPIAGSTTVPAGGSIGEAVAMTVPDTAAAGDVQVCVTASLPNGARSTQDCFTLTVNGTLSVPGGVLSFRLHGAQPNPARRNLNVTFSLPSSAPARLELIDVNGRRVFVREVGDLGAGTHVVRIEREGAALPAGVYAMKLTQGGRVLSRKVSVVQ